MKLVTFRVNDGSVKGETFSVYGTYTIETGKTLNPKTLKLEDYEFPEFYDLEGKQVVGKKEIPFTPEGEAWNGRKYDVEDMICDFFRSALLGSSLYELIYLEEGLTKILKFYIENSAEVNEKHFAKNILSYDMCDLYELLMVTNEYAYYGSGDQFLMIGTENRLIVSDNYFAEVGFDDSVTNVRNGKETLLWGELPEEEEE